MITAAALLLGVLVVGWWSPRPLSRLSALVGPGTALAWWLLTAAGLVVGTMAGVLLLVLPGHGPAAAVLAVLHDCWAAVGHGELPALDPIAGGAAAAVVLAAATRLALVSAGRRRRHAVLHRRHLVALQLSGAGGDGPLPTLWVPRDEPVAYSLGGRRALIVASTGLKDRLSARELHAVLAHERAHVRGRHHLLTAVADVLGRTLGFVPLLRELPGAVRLLVELAADRAAAAQCGAGPLRSALLAIRAVEGPRRSLAMAGGDTAIRLQRLTARTGPRLVTRAAAVAGGFAALVAPAAVAVALVAGTSLVWCP
ncbi:M56 family metallopeptidase [Amycolatopsis vancoresmycina]|uniref:M56 family metallopeptidase n=1 Tax=Amycolatopsis vancoresmycina TaxID=208444 RepID=UPI000527730C|nr:M56 family metallopeptidase [Amycolatopsis vancoresmycina]